MRGASALFLATFTAAATLAFVESARTVILNAVAGFTLTFS
jgi:hypothetical protein